MKRLAVLLLLAAAALAGYRYYAATLAPERHYRAFAEEVLHQHYQTVTLRKSASGWKISAFENKLGKVDSLTRH